MWNSGKGQIVTVCTRTIRVTLKFEPPHVMERCLHLGSYIFLDTIIARRWRLLRVMPSASH